MSLLIEATQRGLKVVTPKTCAKYGITQEEWLELLAAQGWRCAVCHRHRGVTFTTDHEHVPGWRKMPPEQRRRYVRGVLCTHCNYRVVHSNLSARQAQRIADYLTLYEARRNGYTPPPGGWSK
jgi:transposase-like protein